MTTNPRQRPPLRLAPPAGDVPDTRAAIARALLGPVHQVIDDQATLTLGGEAAEDLRNNPLYLIGRLQQALSALLEREVPPLDATATLLADAIGDAIRYRQQGCPQCGAGICARCRPDWAKAARYEDLWRELGLVDEMPKPSAGLTAVTP